MTTTTMQLFHWQLKMLNPKKLPTMTDPDQIVPITFELFPKEVLEAAVEALGKKVLTEYFIQMYIFAIESKAKGLPIKVSQLSGVLLTHTKIEKWFDKTLTHEFANTGVSVAVFNSYVQYHQARIAQSELIVEELRTMAGFTK